MKGFNSWGKFWDIACDIVLIGRPTIVGNGILAHLPDGAAFEAVVAQEQQVKAALRRFARQWRA